MLIIGNINQNQSITSPYLSVRVFVIGNAYTIDGDDRFFSAGLVNSEQLDFQLKYWQMKELKLFLVPSSLGSLACFLLPIDFCQNW